MTRRLTTLLAALALTTTVTAACGGGDAENAAIGKDGTVDLSKVTLRVGDQKGGAQALITAAGLLTDVKYKITWNQFTSGPPLLEAANAGAIDVGAVGNTPPIFAAAAKSKITVISGANMSLRASAIVLPRDSTTRTPAELKGKRIAVAKGSSAHYHLLSVLKKAGLTFKDIQPQYLQPADALAALTSGKIDAWAIWDPFTAQAEATAGARILVDGTGYSNGYNFQVAARKALDDKAKVAALRDYVTRYQKALVWAKSHIKEWAAVWAKETGLPVPVAEVAARRRVATLIKLDDTVISSEQQMADTFFAEGLLPAKVDIGDYIDGRFNDIEVPA